MIREPTPHAAPIWPAVLLIAAAIGLALLLAGCGGGDEVLVLHSGSTGAALRASAGTTSTATATAGHIETQPLAAVQLTGCVVDDYFQPRADTPVRATAADGRLVANAHSDARGAFRLAVPAGQALLLAVETVDGDFIKVASGLRSRVLATCLVDPSA